MNRAIDDSCSNAALGVTPLQSNSHASLSLLLSAIALRPRLWLLVLEHVSTALWPLDLVINLVVLSGVQEACGGHRSQSRVLPRAPERWTLAALMMSAPTLTESQTHSGCSASDEPGGTICTRGSWAVERLLLPLCLSCVFCSTFRNAEISSRLPINA